MRAIPTICLILAAATPAAATTYTMQDLGTLGGRVVEAYAVNNAGQVVGTSWINPTNISDGSNRAFIWQNGVMSEAGILFGVDEGRAVAINSSGVAAGSGGPFPYLHAGRFVAGAVTDLGTVSNTIYGQSRGYGINDAGVIVGQTSTTVFGGGQQAFRSENGAMTALGTIAGGGTKSLARAINNAGLIVGFNEIIDANNMQFQHATLYRNGAWVDLGAGTGTTSSEAFAINEAGQIVGSTGDHATLWTVGSSITTTDLGRYNLDSTIAYGVNESGLIVGEAKSTNNVRTAVVYQNGAWVDLNTLATNLGGYRLESARGVNDLGQIVGFARLNGDFTHLYSFIITPDSLATVPEPATCVLALGASLAIGRVRRRA